MLEHDFKKRPELWNSQLTELYWQSPHRQIFEPFTARVIGVHDGDTIKVRWSERDFDFPIRFAEISAPELNERGGKESQKWLEGRILGKDVTVVPTPERVEKHGRLLAAVYHNGVSLNKAIVEAGHALLWEERTRGLILDFIKNPILRIEEVLV
uniref:Putative nuclease n=1 Tax=viral metagenome TaxID=1070528 RepID=A0A6M3XHJ8_9ZZZZ